MSEVTWTPDAVERGDLQAAEKLLPLVYDELRKLAAQKMVHEAPGHTLQPTAILNEAFLRLAAIKRIEWQERGQFLAIAARVMRRLLIDYARSQPTVQFIPLEDLPAMIQRDRTPREIQIAISTLLEELEVEAPQKRTIVDLKNVLGFTDEEVAEALGLSLRDAQRQWFEARKWLYQRMIGGGWKQALSTTT